MDSLKHFEGGRRIREGMRPQPPLVSIVTVVFRDRGELEHILRNVFTFDTSQFELIVIDGGSDDGTVELLQQWDGKIDYWLSEPDSGLYHAMNKGRAVAKGKFLFHLNAGDRLLFLPNKELESADIDEAEVVTFPVSIDGSRQFSPAIGRLLRIRNTLHHQGTFYRRECFPAYDLQYRVYADFDLNQRMAKRGAKIGISERIVASHSTAGISNRASDAEPEHYRIIRSNFGWPYAALSWAYRKWDGLMVRLGRPVQKV